QSPRLKNIELCNGGTRASPDSPIRRSDRTSPDLQIRGCTALIDLGDEKPYVLSIAHNNRGNAYAAKGDYARAIENYDESIKLNPGYARAFNNRGVVYLKKGEYDRAMKDFDEAIRLNSDYAIAFANRAETYQRTNDYGHAAADYDEA